MDKLKLASSSLGERLKTGSAQMSRLVSTKVKEILQSPTLESKMVDEATSDHLDEPNWGMNLRICAMINSEEFSGTEVVKAIKKKLCGKSGKGQRLSLDLLEACTSNCDKVFSEVASEKVLDEMVRVIEDGKSDGECRVKALELVRAWGESEDLKYLPVFHHTYMDLLRWHYWVALCAGSFRLSRQEAGLHPDEVFYYVYTAAGAHEIVAEAVRVVANHLVYRSFSNWFAASIPVIPLNSQGARIKLNHGQHF